MRTKAGMIRLITVAGIACVLLFQNCGQKKLTRPGDDSGGPGDVVIASTQNVSKVTYDPQLEMSPATPALSLDLQSGVAEIGGVSCNVEQARLARITDILATGEICKPAPLPDDVPRCMAIGIADVKLEESAGASETLRPVVCNYGQYLCDGQDPVFRDLLQDLVNNPPADCQ